MLLIHCRLGAGVSQASASFWVEELLVNGFARIAVPLFFFISGFLFFLKWDGTAAAWLVKLRRRVRSLLIPYLICSAIGLIIIRVISKDPMPGIGQTLAEWLWNPAAFHLWFVRELMLFALLAWLWYKIPRPAKWILLGVTAVAWIQDWNPLPFLGSQPIRSMEGLLFYFLGAILAIDQKYDQTTIMESFLNLMARLQLPLALVWIVFTVTRFYLIHQQGVEETPILLALYKLAIFTGTAAVIGYGAKDRSIPSPGRDTTFFIYLYHLPRCLYVRNALERLFTNESLVLLSTVAISLAISWLVSLLLKRRTPQFHATLAGGRS